MTTKRTTGRYGDSPGRGTLPGSAQRGAPLPLVTQPMVAIDDTAGVTRVDAPYPTQAGAQQVIEQAATHNPHTIAFTRATAMSPPLAKAQTPAGPPPEIGLSQHHIPPEEPLDGRLALVVYPDSDRSAAFRVLRHHLLEHGRPKDIVVSSAHSGEGKTTVALNLALALAECGRAKVLLCDARLRDPQLAGVFRLVPPWCFAEQLAAHRHQPKLTWSLVEITQQWLHVAAVSTRIEKILF